MVAAAQHGQPEAVRLQHRCGPRLLDIAPCADPVDSRRRQVLERVEEGLCPEVERVVVRERHAVDAQPLQDLGRGGRRAEEERLARVGPRRPTLRDAALEVEDEQVGGARECNDLVGDEVAGAVGSDRLRDPTAQHRVSRQCEPHAAKRRTLPSVRAARRIDRQRVRI
jgi:hypothetical protein